MQGDITGQIGGANSMNDQLKVSQVEMPAMASSVESSDRNTGDTIKYRNDKCHQGTQTELFVVSSTDIVRQVREEE